MIHVENLSVSFGSEQVLQNISFVAHRGQKVALAGPSGSGKSTIINLLMGFVHPYAGNVRVAGLTLSEQTVNQVRSRISWLPQELAFRLDTVRELFFLPFTYRINRHLRPSDDEVRRLFDELLLDVALLDKPLGEISGGQKQRIALASVLLLKRDILLLDEPTSALDAESRGAIIGMVKRLTDVTVLVSSHDAEWMDAVDTIIDLRR